jgi:3-hydroxyisobutyrate dehydrogenase-like beta-hydroxyacid dehydrogenase
MTTPVGFIGLGGMGLPMATRLLEAGHPLAVFNRTPHKAAPLVSRGAESLPSPRDVAVRCGVVITMLGDPAAVHAVLSGPDGLLAGARDGLVLIDMSTVGPPDARATVEQAAAQGVCVIHAPVLGSIGAARRGELIVLAGGPRDLADEYTPLLLSMGASVNYVGGNEQACAMKLAVNAVLLGSLQLFGEAVALATGAGIPRSEVLRIMGLSPAVSGVIKGRMAELEGGELQLTFPLRLARKDLWLALGAGYESGASLPIVAAALETYTLALREHAEDDEFGIIPFMEESVWAKGHHPDSGG